MAKLNHRKFTLQMTSHGCDLDNESVAAILSGVADRLHRETTINPIGQVIYGYSLDEDEDIVPTRVEVRTITAMVSLD